MKINVELLEKLHKLNDFLLNDRPNRTQDPFEDYKKIKAFLSGQVITEKLSINGQLLTTFENCINKFRKFQHDNNESLRKIAALRLAIWLDTISKNTGTELSLNSKSSLSNEDLAIKQIRAIELIIRDLVYEKNGGTKEVLKTLEQFFKSEIIQKWLSNSDETGVLSGTTFSELSSLFINKRLFASYDDIFDNNKGLSYEKTKIKSLHYFLDDIRLIRNLIAHNKTISSLQIELLNEYYTVIIGSIGHAYKEEKTQINPGVYLNVSKEKIGAYIDAVKADMHQIKENIGILSDKMDKGFDELLSDTDAIKVQASKSKSRLTLVIAGISIIIILSLTILMLFKKQTNNSDQIFSNTQEISKDINDIEENIDIKFEEIASLLKTSNTIENPKKLKDFILNAYLFKNSGDLLKAEESFKEFISRSGLEKYDLFMDYFEVLKINYGNSKAMDVLQICSDSPLVELIIIENTLSGEQLLDELEKVEYLDSSLMIWCNVMHGNDIINEKYKHLQKNNPFEAGNYIYIAYDELYKNHKALGENYEKIEEFFFNKKLLFDIYEEKYKWIKMVFESQFNEDFLELMKPVLSAKAYKIYKHYALNPIE